MFLPLGPELQPGSIRDSLHAVADKLDIVIYATILSVQGSTTQHCGEDTFFRTSSIAMSKKKKKRLRTRLDITAHWLLDLL